MIHIVVAIHYSNVCPLPTNCGQQTEISCTADDKISTINTQVNYTKKIILKGLFCSKRPGHIELTKKPRLAPKILYLGDKD